MAPLRPEVDGAASCGGSCACDACAELPGIFATLRAPPLFPTSDTVKQMWAEVEARQKRGLGALSGREQAGSPGPAWRPQPVALPPAGSSVNAHRRRADDDDSDGLHRQQLSSALSGNNLAFWGITSLASEEVHARSEMRENANASENFETPGPLPILSRVQSPRVQARRRGHAWIFPELSNPSRHQAPTKDADRCDGWDLDYAYAAPLLDPAVVNGSSLCPSEADTRWRLYTTSPAFATLGNGQQRMYFFDGTLRNPLADPSTTRWPTQVVLSDGTTPFKFNAQIATSSQTEEAWWRAEYSSGQSVSTLRFSKQFIAFLDSDDGVVFNLFTPLLINPTEAGRCDFTRATVHYSWIELHNQQLSIRQAGWKSTVIPCHYAGIVYKMDSVLCVPIPDANPVWVMFAVRCSGAGLGTNGSDLEEGLDGACPLCSPSTDDASICIRPGHPTPVTDYVIFVSESPDFREGTLGPFGLLPDKPDDDAGQWVGVPQAWMSDDGRFIFYYVHPNRGESGQPTAYEGLNVARTADFGIRLALASIQYAAFAATDSALHPAHDDAGVLDQIEQTRAIISPAFRNLGNIEVCAQDLDNLSEGDPWVDEHFIFCDGRLHLYYTHLGEFVEKPRDEPRLDAIHRASARAAFSPILLELFLESGAPAVPSLIEDMLLRFKLADCSVFNADNIESSSEVEPQVNDPTVHFGVGSDRGHTVLHFFSEAEQALLVLTADRPCGEGRCPPDFDSKHTRPPEIVRQFFRPELS